MISSKQKVLEALYKDLEKHKGDYDAVCSVITLYVGRMLGHRCDDEALDEALELYEDFKEQAFNAGYIDRTTKAFD